MRRQPLLALLAVAFALPAYAGESRYDGPDTEKETRYRRLFTPWEFALFIDADADAVRGDPAVAGYGSEQQAQVRASGTRMLAALDGDTPDYDAALRELSTVRSTLMVPVTDAYLAASAAPASSGGPLSAFESTIWDAMQVDWLPSADRLALHGRTADPQHVRAFLRAEASGYKQRPPAGRIDPAQALAPVAASIRGVLSGDETTLAAVYGAAGMTRASAPSDPRMADVNDRAARLRAVMPEGEYTALERTVLATVLTDQAFAEVAAGRSALDLHREALDAANLAMADQSHAEIRAAIAGKTIFKPGSLAALRSAVAPADMSSYVCGAASRVPGGPGSSQAMAQATQAARRSEAAVSAGTDEAAADDADVIRVETTALPGISAYCQQTASLRSGTRTADERPLRPEQHLGPAADVPGPSSAGQTTGGTPTAGSEDGGLLGRAGSALKGSLPYMAVGAAGGLLVAAAMSMGPMGLVGGLLLGAGIGALLGMFGKQ